MPSQNKMLRWLDKLNNRLKEDLERDRIPVSEASKSIIVYCNTTPDYMVPSVWGAAPSVLGEVREEPAPQKPGLKGRFTKLFKRRGSRS
ncbi:hypothetical protein GGTG_04676 [Gaeumannomyces tritici R3-111a-1]|uniref:Guanine nucleotide-binding protein subunit gamma n=1 Tax=Gaeumannomyces tritici (strain R3-111a-1) TaxID=644352 RepID=J3NTS7_GAET3|nr:hypothetical protein GGTG_04676 [Gaeumannomyces tritici R3-111a-1]EJT79592.1 hypothetical protein GGTG_04676 [Gaeumannomyces tritici R3-111a-1]